MRHDPSAFVVPPEMWYRAETLDALRRRDVGALFRLVRQWAGGSQTGIMMRTGIAKSEISTIMAGHKRVATLERFEAIADGLEMPDHARMALGLAPRVQVPVDTGTVVGGMATVRSGGIELDGGLIFPGASLPVANDSAPGFPHEAVVTYSNEGLQIGRQRHRSSYHLDDLTVGLLWALTNIEDSLLCDDASLEAARSGLRHYEALPGSAVSKEAIPELSTISRLWLGSDFAARHILMNASDVALSPTFWTVEQRGEEASMWLFFRHKLTYLQETVRGMVAGGRPLVRNFCVPESAVSGSPHGERILLLLAMALMEALGIEVRVVDDGELTSTEGFVLLEEGAIVANWLSGEGLWHVDRLGRSVLVREMEEKAAFAEHHSLASVAPHARGRLQLLAEYLDVDWAWIVGRCAQLQVTGLQGLLCVRSRLVSIEGVEIAVSFLANNHDLRSR